MSFGTKIFGLLFFAIGIISTASADEGLVAHWTFDADLPEYVIDSGDGEFHATSDREFPHVAGVFGKAIDLSGQYRIVVPKEVVPSGLRELTFSAWVMPRNLSGYREIFRKEDAGRHGETRLLFSFQNDGRFLALGLNTGGDYAECDAVIATEELLDGNWHYIVGTFDGQFMRVYLNGKEIGSFERQGNLTTVRDFAPITVGRDDIASRRYQTLDLVTVNAPGFIGSSSGTGEFFDGKMDDLRFYSRALSADEIAQMHAFGMREIGSGISNETRDAVSKAAQLYARGNSFLETLVATRFNVEESGALNNRERVALLRLIRADFPAEINQYIMKWQRNPVEVMLFRDNQLQARYSQLETAYYEYLPLTDLQWQHVQENEREQWNRVKAYKEDYEEQLRNNGSPDAALLYEIVSDMESVVEDRPRNWEGVAPYVIPETPPVHTHTAAEARAILEKDWLHQCDGNPTVERSLTEIVWARKLAERIMKDNPGVSFSQELRQLGELETRAKAATGVDQELYFAVRTIKREITFKNPAIDFDSILFVDGPYPQGSEWNHETRHRLGYMAVPGARLMTMRGLHPGGEQQKLMPSEPLHGSFWRPDISYDGKKVLVSFKPHNEKTFNLYEINIDGTGLRQLTAGIFDDLDPIYLPDGKNIMFLTTRGYIYVRCMPPTNAFVMARMALDGGEGVYITSRNGEPEYTPSVLLDGRVIFTRWEYTDKPLWRAQSLWTMNPDGTQVQAFYGNQSVWPDLLKDARQIPGSHRIMFTGSAHHDWYSGAIGIIDPTKGFNFPDGLTKVTQELVWPESGNGSVDPKESDDYRTGGAYRAYYSPYPLNEKDFLVSAHRIMRNAEGRQYGEKFVLMLMDVNGNRELIQEGVHHVWDARPIREREVPPMLIDRVNWTTMENRDRPGTGIIYSNNVYENTPVELHDRAKYLRIWSIEHKTYTYWYKRNYASAGPEISMLQSEGIKRIIGTVPIDEDGSVSFNAPSGLALHFQLLDKNHRALQTMRSFTGVQPGESRGCLGCHESMSRAPVTATSGRALRRAPSDITPVPWVDNSVSFERYVQPALDKHCAECHQDPKHEAFAKFDATLRPGFLGFKEPYITLLGSPTWGTPYRMPENLPGGFGWADTLMVEAFDQRDPVAYSTFAPMTKLSYRSRLVDRMASGNHHDVVVDPENLLRVILWVDAMGPYYGAEEVRQMADPIFQGRGWISQPPRVMTAPIVQRPGPFDPFQTDSAYDSPDDACINALPFGVVRTPAQ